MVMRGDARPEETIAVDVAMDGIDAWQGRVGQGLKGLC